jgi:NADPH:quinone reductase-like Zn-dependent oxidoreductase
MNMKAVVYTKYGPPEVLHLAEMPIPQPKENEVLVHVRTVNINYGDLLARQIDGKSAGKMYMPWLLWVMARLDFGLRAPKRSVLGNEFAGEVAAVGAQVTRFAVGDRVVSYSGQQMGACAEYVTIAEDKLIAPLPAGVTFAAAATLPYGAMTALDILRKVDIGPGNKVLVIGASGSIGAAALQIAKAQGAEVTAVCGTNRMEMVRALGADHAIDYTREQYNASGVQYDVIFDVLGKADFPSVRSILAPQGVYLLASFKSDDLWWMLRTRNGKGQRVICAFGNYTPAALAEVVGMAEAGTLRTVVDRCYPLEEAAAAHAYLEAGSRRGAVVLTNLDE